MGDEAFDPTLRPAWDLGELSMTIKGPQKPEVDHREADESSSVEPVKSAYEIALDRGYEGG